MAAYSGKAGSICFFHNDFGYLAPDEVGNLNYVSLSETLPEEDQFFTTIWQTWAGEDKVYYQAEETIFILEGDSVTAIYPEASFHKSFLVNGDFYVRERHAGLKQLVNGEFEMVPGGEFFKELGVFAMLPLYNAGKIFIATIE